MLNLNWVKCNGGAEWCPFEGVNLSDVATKGVYIIWHAGNPGKVVYVGQGDVADRLTAHRNEQEITQYKNSGKLMVTWAAVSAFQRDGVERFLADKWNPLVGVHHPNVAPIAVNSPW